MNTLSITLTGISIMAAVSVAGAQSGKNMDHAPMGDTMKTTYTGCVETVNHGASYVLTHIADEPMAMMHGDMPMHDGATMKKDESKDMNEPAMHSMAPAAVRLTGTINVRQHVGQRVEVAGSLSKASGNSMPQSLDTLTVSSLKVVAKACTQETQK